MSDTAVFVTVAFLIFFLLTVYNWRKPLKYLFFALLMVGGVVWLSKQKQNNTLAKKIINIIKH